MLKTSKEELKKNIEDYVLNNYFKIACTYLNTTSGIIIEVKRLIDEHFEKYSAEKPIIEINGKKYIAEDPKLKTVHKEGEVVICGFRALDEYELCWQMNAKDETLKCDVCPHKEECDE